MSIRSGGRAFTYFTYTEFPNKEERTIWTAGTKRELMISLHFVVDLVRSVVRPRSRRRREPVMYALGDGGDRPNPALHRRRRHRAPAAQYRLPGNPVGSNAGRGGGGGDGYPGRRRTTIDVNARGEERRGERMDEYDWPASRFCVCTWRAHVCVCTVVCVHPRESPGTKTAETVAGPPLMRFSDWRMLFG